MTLLKKLIASLVLLPGLVLAAESNFPLDHAPDRTKDLASLQNGCLLYTSPSPRDQRGSRMPSSA